MMHFAWGTFNKMALKSTNQFVNILFYKHDRMSQIKIKFIGNNFYV